jgi:hypothetical protein
MSIASRRRRSVLCGSLLLLLWAPAHADDLMLRIRQNPLSPTDGGYEVIHAAKGRFVHQPELRTPADGDLMLIGRSAGGKEVFQRTVRNPGRLNAEAFDPVTGKIVQARPIQRAGVVEVRMPLAADVSSVELHALRAGRSERRAGDAIKRLSRPEIDDLSARSGERDRLRRAQQGRNVTTEAVPTGSALLWGSTDTATRMDYILIGDGYTEAEQAKWQADAQGFADGLLADPLFTSFNGVLNVRRVDIVSAESGITEGGVTRNTALGSVLGCFGIDRLLCVDETKVFDAVGSITPTDGRDVIVVIANTTSYGGAGGSVATMTLHESSTELGLHEIGHTAFSLADEYDYGTCSTFTEPSEANVTIGATAADAKWGSLIAGDIPLPTPPGVYPNGTLGLFTGAKYCVSGVYRPTEDSRMRTLGQPWHQVNENRAAEVFDFYSGGGSGNPVVVSGRLSGTSDGDNHPAAAPGSHYSARGGKFSLTLSGPRWSNFQLYLYKWDGAAWAVVDRSERARSKEAIAYNGTPGYYYAQVLSAEGGGRYTLNYTFPE